MPLAAGDFNGDGTDAAGDIEHPLLRPAQPGWHVQINRELAAEFPCRISTGDFINDGSSDIVIPTNVSIAVVVGVSNGTALFAVNYAASGDRSGRFHGDGNFDIAKY